MSFWLVFRDINGCVVAALECDTAQVANDLKSTFYFGHACTAEITDQAPFFVERFRREFPEDEGRGIN